MTFQRRVFLTITLILLLLLGGNFVVNTMNAKTYFSTQLAVVANDAAMSLGFGISTAAREKDQAQIESMIDVMFDSGYYLSIHYIDVDGVLVASRARPLVAGRVPAWFIQLITLPLSSGVAEVVSGWYQLGQVRIVAHPGFAYENLWRVFIDMLWLFFFGLVFAYGLLGSAIWFLLRPLKHLEAQADAIAQQHFHRAVPLSGIPEFRRVNIAMNRMSTKISEMFGQQLALAKTLRDEVYTDALTGLANRKEFNHRLAAWFVSDEGRGSGGLILVSLSKLGSINDTIGRNKGDEYLQLISAELKHYFSGISHALLARHSGTDFSVYVPEIDKAGLTKKMNEVKARLTQKLADSAELGTILRFGGVFFAYPKPVEQIFSAVDESLRLYATESENRYIVQLDDTDVYRQAEEWRPVIEAAIREKTFKLVYQPIFAGEHLLTHHHEALCRLEEGNALVPACVFWPLVERFAMSGILDRYIVSEVLEKLSHEQNLCLSVNISAASVQDATFRDWLQQEFDRQEASLLKRLYLELPENILNGVDHAIESLILYAKSNRVGVIIDHFGLNPTSIGFLQDIRIDYVKIDKRFIAGLDRNKENRLYLRAMLGLCEASGVGLIAEGVETQASYETLKAMGIPAMQGFYLAEPNQSIQSTNNL